MLACARAAAAAAGQHALAHRHRRMEADARPGHDVKLALDRECQAKAAEVILQHYPDHAILGEESSHERAGEVPRWIVDPIDGTVNFSHGWSIWCTAVAVEVAGQTQVGVVYAPALNEWYTAVLGGPARLNGEPLRVSDIRTMSEALLLTDTNKEPYDFPAGTALYGRFLHAAQKTRVTGSAALDICRVARGHAEGYTALGIYPWDTAAAALILTCAGGRFEVIEQLAGHRFRAVCSNGYLHEEIRRIFLDTIPSH